jgi:hypothetical protein
MANLNLKPHTQAKQPRPSSLEKDPFDPEKTVPPSIQLTFESEAPELNRIFHRAGKLIQEGQSEKDHAVTHQEKPKF